MNIPNQTEEVEIMTSRYEATFRQKRQSELALPAEFLSKNEPIDATAEIDDFSLIGYNSYLRVRRV